MALATMISLASAAVAFADPPRQVAKVRCTDGTQDKPGKHACKRHGGKLHAGRIDTDKLKPVVPRDATASRRRVVCADGTVTTKTGRGVCARHGGVAPTTTHAGEPVALCRDGWVMTPTDHPATCLLHGGLREWIGG